MLPINGWDILSSLKGDPRTAKNPVIVVAVMDQREPVRVISKRSPSMIPGRFWR
jgi:hypothetical protein